MIKMDIQWGQKVDCYNPNLKSRDYNFYESFTYLNEKFRLGEFVVFKQCNGLAYPTIARLLCMFQADDNYSYKGIVQWYTWAANFKFKENNHQINFDKKNEVIQNEICDIPCEECIVNLTDIQQKCYVIFATLDDPVHLIKKYNYNTINHFSCRYKIQRDLLVPVLQKDNFSEAGNSYILCTNLETTDKHLAVFESSPVIKSTTLKTSPGIFTRQKRRSKNNLSPITVLNYDKCDEEHVLQIKSPLNPLKCLKLTPKFATKKVNLIGRNSSVKRVLNDSFGDSHILGSEKPVLPYSIVCLKNDDSEHIKMTFKLTNKQPANLSKSLRDKVIQPKSQQEQNPNKYGAFCDHITVNKKLEDKTELKVFPTTLHNEIIKMKSPIKIGNLQNIDNCVRLMPNNDFNTTPSVTSCSNRTANHLAAVRRSSRTVQRKCYVDYSSPECSSPKKSVKLDSNVENLELNHLNQSNKAFSKGDGIIKDVIESTPRPKRNIRRPKKYAGDGSNEVIVTNNCHDVAFDMSSDKLQLINDLKQKSDKTKPSNYKGTDRKQNIENGKTAKHQITCSVHTPVEKVGCLRSSTSKNATEIKYAVNTLDNAGNKSDATYSTSKKTKIFRSSSVRKVCKKLDSDEEGKAPKKFAAKTPVHDTPSGRSKLIREGIITPSMQSRSKAVLKNNTPLCKARVQLHVSFVPKFLPCREKEFSDIMNFLKGKLLDGCGGCMYISGVPGTGKTATVTETIRTLQQSAEKGDIVSFKYINVNGMQLSEPRQSYVEIIRQLTGKTVRWEQAQAMLENKFVKSHSISTPVILVIDELDILCTKRQDVVYNLLDWPTKANAQLIVITIANTMDLPERLLMGRVTSRLGLTRLTFQAYTFKQLQEIVTKRLLGISAFNPDAIQLVARKVASVSGDARRALDICRRAVEIAELEGKNALVSMDHVNQAVNAMIAQPKVQAIKSCSKLEKLVLQAVVAEVERTGIEETNFNSVFTMLMSLATLDDFYKVSSTLAMTALSKLGACRLLLIDQKCSNIYQRIILNVSSDDVYYALTKTHL